MHTYIIDDDHISIFLTEQALKIKGIQRISTFLSAEDALGKLMDIAPDSYPGIIFLDINMPEMSGWEFLDALKPVEEKLLGHTRIYILTSSLDQTDAAKSNNYSLVHGFIHKPLDIEDVQAVLSQIEEES